MLFSAFPLARPRVFTSLFLASLAHAAQAQSSGTGSFAPAGISPVVASISQIDTLVDNGDDTCTHTASDGTAQTFDCSAPLTPAQLIALLSAPSVAPTIAALDDDAVVSASDGSQIVTAATSGLTTTYDLTNPNPLVDPGAATFRMSAAGTSITVGKTVDQHATSEVSFGVLAGNNNSGVGLSAFGRLAGEENSGASVTALGLSAMRANTGGSSVGVGASAGEANTGGFVTALGQQAARYNEGDFNTAVGQRAMFNAATNPMTGSGNTALGRYAFSYPASMSVSNSTALGYQAEVTASNQIVLGNSSVTELRSSADAVFSGTSYPSDERLKTKLEPLPSGLAIIAGLRPRTYVWDFDADLMETRPERKEVIEISGAVLDEDGTEIRPAVTETTIFPAATVIPRRLKNRQEAGVLAGDVLEVFPYAVRSDSSGIRSVDYARLTVPLIAAVQELAAQNLELQARLDALEAAQ